MASGSEAQTDRKAVSCTECRRRKAKCDKLDPCSPCAKSSRQCSYETPARTPLTRKHLDDVEDELARTKRRLAQYEGASSTSTSQLDSFATHTSDQLALRPDQEDPSNLSFSPTSVHTTTQALQQQQRRGDAVYNAHPSYPFQLEQHHAPAQQPATPRQSSFLQQQQQQHPQPANVLTHDSTKHAVSALEQVVHDSRGPQSASQLAVAQSLLTSTYSFSLERPHAPDEFEWDERDCRKRTAGASDGMASLTQTSSGGYMGVASGAALLRLADDSIDPAFTTNGDNDKNESRQSRANSVPIMDFNSVSQLEPFVNAYFQTYHKCYPIVHEATFRAQFMEIIPQPKSGSWQVLLYVIAAVGAFSSSEGAIVVDQALFAAAKARLSIDMVETGNLTMVQALTLLSNYSQKRNKPNSGYNYLGLAKRMAMGIGLHKEFPSWRTKPLVLEMRRRVWWCLYIFDMGAIITFSRPLDLPSEGIEVEIPLNVHDRDITPMTQAFPLEVQATTLYTHVRCQAAFHLATSGIYTRMISTPYPTAEQMLQLDDNHLVHYESSMPSWYQEPQLQLLEFRLPCSIMRWRVWNFRTLMLRAFLMRQIFLRTQLTSYQDPLPPGSPYEQEAVRRCLKASSDTIQSIIDFWYQGTQNVLACWYALYFLFQAVLIPVVCLRNEPISSLSDTWRDQIRRTIEVLNNMSHLNEAAPRFISVINSLCGVFLTSSEQGPSPINESPQTQLNNLYSFMWPLSDGQISTDFALHEFSIQDLLHQIGDVG